MDVLVLTRSRDLLERALGALKPRYRVRHATSASRAEEVVRTENVGVLVTNAVPDSLPRLLPRLRAWNPYLSVIAVGRREPGDDQTLLAMQSSGEIFRFLIEPTSQGQLALYTDAGMRAFQERLQHSVAEAREALQTPCPAPADPPARPRNRSVVPFSLAALVFISSAGGLLLLGQQDETASDPLASAGAAAPIEGDDGVARALAAANEARREGRFVEPPGDNAHYFYRQILGLYPNHRDAAQGVNELVNLMFTQAERALREGALDEAGAALERARRIAPSHPRLSVIGVQIETNRQERLVARALDAARAARYAQAQEILDEAARTVAGESARVRAARGEVAAIRKANEETLASTREQFERALANGQLLPPWTPNARDHLRLLRTLGAPDDVVRRCAERLLDALTQRAGTAIDARDFASAERDIEGLATLADDTYAAVRAEALALELAQARASEAVQTSLPAASPTLSVPALRPATTPRQP